MIIDMTSNFDHMLKVVSQMHVPFVFQVLFLYALLLLVIFECGVPNLPAVEPDCPLDTCNTLASYKRHGVGSRVFYISCLMCCSSCVCLNFTGCLSARCMLHLAGHLQ